MNHPTKLTSDQFRLLLAGVYPVEFRDFFLGDMYCSQTYSMGVSGYDRSSSYNS